MALETVHEIVRKAEQNYTSGPAKTGKYVDFDMYDTVETIFAYLNSKHTSGPTDALGREKPFYNIVQAAVNIWYRATDIDRKDIRFMPKRSGHVLVAFVANVLLQNWMDKTHYGQFLNRWGRTMAEYGGAITKHVEVDGELIPSVIPWNRFIPDTVQFDAIPRIEKFYLTPAQLRKHPLYDQSVVNDLIDAVQSRETLDNEQKDNVSEFIELYEVTGELDSRLLQEKPDMGLEDKDIKYRLQMHVIASVEESAGEQKDFTLYKGKVSKDPYDLSFLVEEEGRTLPKGAVEHLLESQWMKNHSVKLIKDTLDIASKLIFQTADSNFVGRNVLSAIEVGDVLVHGKDMPLNRIANDKPDITALQNFGTMWETLGQTITATPDAMRGITPPASTPYSTTALITGQSNSLFELMTENKGLSIEKMVLRHFVPWMKKKLNSKEEIVAILDEAGIEEIDAIYIPAGAVRRFNARAKESIINGEPVAPFDPSTEEAALRRDLSAQGNKRFFKPDEIDSKTWKDIFEDFDWNSLRVEVTNEQSDKQMVLQTLASLYTATLAVDPIKANVILGKIMTETGVFSPMEIGLTRNNTTPTVPPSGGAQAISNIAAPQAQ